MRVVLLDVQVSNAAPSTSKPTAVHSAPVNHACTPVEASASGRTVTSVEVARAGADCRGEDRGAELGTFGVVPVDFLGDVGFTTADVTGAFDTGVVVVLGIVRLVGGIRLIVVDGTVLSVVVVGAGDVLTTGGLVVTTGGDVTTTGGLVVSTGGQVSAPEMKLQEGWNIESPAELARTPPSLSAWNASC